MRMYPCICVYVPMSSIVHKFAQGSVRVVCPLFHSTTLGIPLVSDSPVFVSAPNTTYTLFQRCPTTFSYSKRRAPMMGSNIPSSL